MNEIGIYPAITASIGGKQRRLTLVRQWRRAIENGELDRSTPVHYEAGPGHGSMIEAGGCPELAALFDEIKGPMPQPQPWAEQPTPDANEFDADRLARIEGEIAAMPIEQSLRRRILPQSDYRTDAFARTISAELSADSLPERSGLQWAMLPLKRYAAFEGRAQRSEYWNFQLFVTLPLFFLIGVAGIAQNETLLGMLALIWLGLFIPGVAVTVRRLHDRGLSGWLVVLCGLFSLIPVVGFLSVLGFIILMLLPGTAGSNQHGPDPKG